MKNSRETLTKKGGKIMLSQKNYNRSKYSFANINFLDKCNLDCFFCLGKDLEEEFTKYSTLNIHYKDLPNLDKYLEFLKENDIKQIYLTGQNTDPLLYEYLQEFIDYLQNNDFFVGIRTNGIKAIEKMTILNKFNTCMGDAVGYSIISLHSDIHKKICGTSKIPDWSKIFEMTQVPYRVSVVINIYNQHEIEDIIQFVCNYKSQYIQLRRISTDTRYELLKPDIEAYYTVKDRMLNRNISTTVYEKAKVIQGVYPVDVVFWETVSTTANSMNYFTNGVISTEYFIIEGYLKNVEKI